MADLENATLLDLDMVLSILREFHTIRWDESTEKFSVGRDSVISGSDLVQVLCVAFKMKEEYEDESEET